MALLTLPPEIGRKYFYRMHPNHGDPDELYECEIIREEERGSHTVFISHSEAHNNWVFWPDGKAKVHPYDDPKSYVARLVEDIHTTPELPESADFTALRENHDAMMRRLQELGV